MPLTPPETNIPILTDAIVGANGAAWLSARETLVAELQTKLASRTFALAEQLLRGAVAQIEASLFEQIAARLRRELPELIDATLREHLATDDDPLPR
jgi:hypothetical protein